MKSIQKLSVILLAAASCAALPVLAQPSPTAPATTNAAPAAPAAPRAPRNANRYIGIVSGVDSATMTLTIKSGRGGNVESKVKVTSTTKIKKDGEAGTFADVANGVRVSGSGKKGDDGVWTASTLNIITKAAAPKAPPAPKPQQ